VVGLALAVVAMGGLLSAAWMGWAKLPFLVLPGGAGLSPRRVRKHSPSQPSYTPESKIMLGAGVLSLSAFAVTMLGARTLNIPAVAYALAIVAGVLARNVPQRGGSLRLEPVTRWVVGLGPALVAAGWLAWIVAPAAFANYKLKQATTRLEQVAAEKPGSSRSNAQELISEAEDELQKANGANPNSARVWVQMAWLHLEQSVFDPAGFDTFSQQAEEAAGRAVDIAPEAPAPHVALALAYLINNRLNEAELQVRQALDLAPNDPLVQYYAVAVLALEPSNRMTARQLVEMVEDGTYPAEHVRHMRVAYQWGVTSKVSLEGERQRPLPPRYVPAAPWPPLNGLSRDEAEAEAPPPLTPVKPAPGKPAEAAPAKSEVGNVTAAP
jgi:tetratricopeptide (TPR) repeat protein